MESSAKNAPQKAMIARLSRAVHLGVTEVLFLLGLVLMFFGMWLWLGLGQALFGVGCLLVSAAMINDLRGTSHV